MNIMNNNLLKSIQNENKEFPKKYIYLSNDCLMVNIFKMKNYEYNFPLNQGVIKKDDYIKLLKNIQNIDFGNVEFYTKRETGFEPHQCFDEREYIVGHIDNTFDYYFVHASDEGLTLETLKEKYFREYNRWDKNKKFIRFVWKDVIRPFDKITCDDVVEMMNTPSVCQKILILGGTREWTLHDIDISKINDDVLILNVDSDFPQDYAPSLIDDNIL